MTSSDLLKILGRGGNWQYYLTGFREPPIWFKAGKETAVPSGTVYFGVHPSLEKLAGNLRGGNENVAAINCLFAEFDQKDGWTLDKVNAIKTQPSTTVSSGGGWHLYWFLFEPLMVTNENRDQISQLQARWVEYMGGDDGAKDLARVLRVPGSINHKYMPPRPVKIIHEDYSKTFTIEYLASLLPEVEKPKPVTTVTPSPIFSENEIDYRIAFWKNKYFREGNPGSRNAAGFELACQLRDEEIPYNQAAEIMREYARTRQQPSGQEPYTEDDAIASLNSAKKEPPRERAVLPRKEKPMQENTQNTEEILTLNIQSPPPEMVEYVSGFDTTDTGNGQRFIALNPLVRYVQTVGKWFVWDGCRWSKDENGEVERRAKNTARSILQEAYAENDTPRAKVLTNWAFKSQGRSGIANMIELAKSEPYITVPFDLFDKCPDYLNFRNGTLDLRTGELKPHDWQDYITKLINLDYDETAKCPRWLEFLDEIMDHNQSLITFLQRAVGYSLTGYADDQVFFTCYGRGANGKSVFLETLLNAMGNDYAINTQAKTILVKDRQGGINNDVARLRGMRFVSVNEIPGRGKLDEAKVKEFTGGDTITARYLFQEEFSFKPEFKLWVRTNHKPVISGVDLGMWRRVRLIPFTVTIPSERQDTKLQEKLRQEWPGILAWAVLGCLAWRHGGLTMPDEVVAATKEYKAEQDTMQPFIDDCCILDKAMTVKASELYTAYKTWAETNGEKPMTNQAFGREISERGFEKYRRGIDNATMYREIALRKL